MRELRAQILAALKADANVTGQATGGVWARRAPEDSVFPYVVFFQTSGTLMYTFAQRSTQTFTFVVKGVTDGTDDGPACDLDAAIDECLTDRLDGVELANGKGTIIECRREADVEYPETAQPGVYLTHKGGSYRVRVAF
jgi:hypothetical protein